MMWTTWANYIFLLGVKTLITLYFTTKIILSSTKLSSSKSCINIKTNHLWICSHAFVKVNFLFTFRRNNKSALEPTRVLMTSRGTLSSYSSCQWRHLVFRVISTENDKICQYNVGIWAKILELVAMTHLQVKLTRYADYGREKNKYRFNNRC